MFIILFNYLSAILNNGLLVLDLRDAIHEGDVPRVIKSCMGVYAFALAAYKTYSIQF